MYKTPSPVALDIEATGLNRVKDNSVISVQLCNNGELGYVIPIHHPESPFSSSEVAEVSNSLSTFVKGGQYPFVVGHNLKYDYTVLKNFLGIEIRKPLADTMCGAFLLDETLIRDDEDTNEDKGNLKGLNLWSRLNYYGYDAEWYKEAKGNSANLYNESLNYVAKYGGADAVLTWHLLRCQIQDAANQNYSKQFIRLLLSFYSHQIKLFSDLETHGMPINLDYLGVLLSPKNSPILRYQNNLNKVMQESTAFIKANSILTQNTASLFGSVWLFDIGKPKHRELLYIDVLKLKPLSHGKSGAPSIDKEFRMAYDYVPEVQVLTKYTRATKLYGTYVKQFATILKTEPDSKDGKIRSSFAGTFTRTGRGSSRNPNLQQTVKEKDALSKIILGLFQTEKGRVFVKLDLRAVEVMIWGDVSQDKGLIEAFRTGWRLRKNYFKEGPSKELLDEIKLKGDFHRLKASRFYKVALDKVTEIMRGSSKSLTFGTIYGLTLHSLSKILKLSLVETKKIVKLFFDDAVEGTKWLAKICRFAKKNLYVENPIGRRRRLWYYLVGYPMKSTSTLKNIKWDKSARFTKSTHVRGDRRAKNTPIQGFASDLAFIGAFLLRYYIKKRKLDWKQINVIHDALESDIPVTDIKKYILASKLIYEIMVAKYVKKTFGYKVTVPLEVEFEVGFTMNDMHKWDGAYKTLDTLQDTMIKEDAAREGA